MGYSQQIGRTTPAGHHLELDDSGNVSIDGNNVLNPSGADGGPPTGNATGDLSGTYPAPAVAKVNGIPVSVGAATIAAQLNGATTRTATAALVAGEETIFTGSTAAQTLTLPAAPQTSSVNTVLNLSSVSVTLAAGAGDLIDSFGTTGSLTLAVNTLVQLVYVLSTTTWYVIDTNLITNSVGTLAVASGGTGAITAGAALTSLGAAPLASPTFTGVVTSPVVNESVSSIAAVANAATVPITTSNAKVTNSSSATITITLATASAVDGSVTTVRVYDFAGVSETIAWVNTENSGVTAATTSNGSTTLPKTLQFQFNGATSKWRCILSV